MGSGFSSANSRRWQKDRRETQAPNAESSRVLFLLYLIHRTWNIVLEHVDSKSARWRGSHIVPSCGEGLAKRYDTVSLADTDPGSCYSSCNCSYCRLRECAHDCVRVNVPTSFEPIGLVRDDGMANDPTRLRLCLGRWSVLWYVMLLASSHLPVTSLKADEAATSAEDLKRHKYAALVGGYIFVPIGVETLGPWVPSDHSLFKELASCLLEAITIQRVNVVSLLGTFPSGSKLDYL